MLEEDDDDADDELLLLTLELLEGLEEESSSESSPFALLVTGSATSELLVLAAIAFDSIDLFVVLGVASAGDIFRALS